MDGDVIAAEKPARDESFTATLRRHVDRAAYRAQQWSIMFPIATFRRVLAALRPGGAEPDPAAVTALRQRYEDLLERDLRNVDAGLYPRALLFQIPLGTYARTVPGLVRDIPRVLRRIVAGDYRDLPAEVDVERYPPYFRRNFHWQTDGYLSRRSAELYDLSVELLFAGTSDVMRRQVIPPLTRFLAAEADRDGASDRRAGGARPERASRGARADGGSRDAERRDGLRLLDVGCGTGRTLAQIAVAHPGLSLYGLDLSPYYLQVARSVLADVPDLSLVVENAERLPFRDGHFDVVTSVHLFHELPRPARRRVLAEMRRVLRPGGLLVIEDSAQLAESGELAFFLGRFAADFHEPFYMDYVEDDLAAALAAAGFEVESVEPQFVAKVCVARQ